MKTILTFCLLLTVLGAINTVSDGMGDYDFIQSVFGAERTVGSDFLLILIGISSVTTLGWGLQKLYSGSKAQQT